VISQMNIRAAPKNNSPGVREKISSRRLLSFTTGISFAAWRNGGTWQFLGAPWGGHLRDDCRSAGLNAVIYGAVWGVCFGAAIGAHAAPLEFGRSLGAALDLAKPYSSDLILVAESRATGLKVGDVNGLAGSPIPLNIKLLGPTDGDQLFVFTGIPSGVTLNPGGFFGKFWAVNSKVIPDLTLTAPNGYSGSFTVSVVRRQEASSGIASTSFKVSITEPPATTATAEPEPAAARPVAAEPAAELAKTERPKPVSRAEIPNEAQLIDRANDFLDKGDVSAARSIYEFLVAQGSAPAAMAMGETYDPGVLRKIQVRGLEPNPEKAREWYQKAEDLGSSDARRRLNELARR
jgi:hypothetical protein